MILLAEGRMYGKRESCGYIWRNREAYIRREGGREMTKEIRKIHNPYRKIK